MKPYDIIWWRAYKASDLETPIAEGPDREDVSRKACSKCSWGEILVGDADTRDGREVGWLPGYHTNLALLG